MEHTQRKKRGRAEDDKEDFQYKNYSKQSGKTKKQDMEHCNNNAIRGKTELEDSNSSSSCNNYISSENHVALGVFDFPWMHEAIVSNSEDWNYILENTFSSSLEEPCFKSHEVKFSDILSDESVETSPAMTLMNFGEDKCVFTESESGDGLGVGLEMEGADYIWGSLLNQPLHSSTRSI